MSLENPSSTKLSATKYESNHCRSPKSRPEELLGLTAAYSINMHKIRHQFTYFASGDVVLDGTVEKGGIIFHKDKFETCRLEI
ncbi:MAG: hypothetical protein K2X93_13850 [Candidatus Obscuribacterales bacterium]|nr:hypothetical protein [Candidatus Obscuribacterales bacterium]